VSLSDRALEALNEHWAVAAIGADELERAGDLVCHPLILLRLSQPLALLRLKLKPSSTKSTCIARLQLS